MILTEKTDVTFIQMLNINLKMIDESMGSVEIRTVYRDKRVEDLTLFCHCL